MNNRNQEQRASGRVLGTKSRHRWRAGSNRKKPTKRRKTDLSLILSRLALSEEKKRKRGDGKHRKGDGQHRNTIGRGLTNEAKVSGVDDGLCIGLLGERVQMGKVASNVCNTEDTTLDGVEYLRLAVHRRFLSVRGGRGRSGVGRGRSWAWHRPSRIGALWPTFV